MVIQKKYIASRKGHIVVSAIMNVTENLDFLNIFKPSLQDKIEPARNFKLAGLLSCFSYYPSRPSRPSRPRARWSPAATWEKKHPGHAVVDNRSTHLRTCTSDPNSACTMTPPHDETYWGQNLGLQDLGPKHFDCPWLSLETPKPKSTAGVSITSHIFP